MLFISKFLHHVELIPFLLFDEMANGTIDPELVLSAVDDDFLAFLAKRRCSRRTDCS